jgi:hypothetical protein
MKRFLSLLIAIAGTGVASAEEPDKRTPLERYSGDGQFALVMCKLQLKTALLKADLGQAPDEKSDWIGCIRQGKEQAKANLAAALRTVKKRKAQEALKSYHVALVTAIDGIAPGADERKISYEQRQQALDTKVTEAWNRFEVEQ